MNDPAWVIFSVSVAALATWKIIDILVWRALHLRVV
jgi:hypothetical protein